MSERVASTDPAPDPAAVRGVHATRAQGAATGCLEHWALVHEGPEEFAEVGAAFLRQGLAQGESVVALAGPALLDGLRARLDGEAHAVSFLDADEHYSRLAAAFTAFGRSLVERRRTETGRLRVIAAPVLAGRSAGHIREYAHLEAFFNVAFAPYDAHFLCAYDRAAFTDEVIDQVRCTHPVCLEDGRPEASGCFAEPLAFIAAGQETLCLEPPAGPVEELSFGADVFPVRRLVLEQGRRAGVDEEPLADFVVAANEVATNALVHGAGQGTARVWAESGALVCDITDTGPGLADPSAGYVLPPSDRLSGRGLWLARQLCDLVEVSSGPWGTTVRLRTAPAA